MTNFLSTISGAVRTALEDQARILIRTPASAGEAIRSLYDKKLVDISNRLENMEVTRSRLQDEAKKVEKMSHIETATLNEVAVRSIEACWKHESRYSGLHRLREIYSDISFEEITNHV